MLPSYTCSFTTLYYLPTDVTLLYVTVYRCYFATCYLSTDVSLLYATFLQMLLCYTLPSYRCYFAICYLPIGVTLLFVTFLQVYFARCYLPTHATLLHHVTFQQPTSCYLRTSCIMLPFGRYYLLQVLLCYVLPVYRSYFAVRYLPSDVYFLHVTLLQVLFSISFSHYTQIRICTQ